MEQETYVLLEVMGHRTHVGKAMKSDLLPGFLRIDVLDREGNVSETKEIGPQAIYGVTYISREVALTLAKRFNAPPVTAWDVRPLVEARLKALAAPDEDEDVGLDPASPF